MDDCNFLRTLFDIDFPCCSSCHEEHEYGIENDVWIPICEHGGHGEDIPFLELCCAFNQFMEELTPKQKKVINDNYDKNFHTE